MTINKTFSGMLLFVTILLIFQSFLYSASMKTSATASSNESPKHTAFNTVDNNINTRWGSEFTDNQWIKFSFNKEIPLTGIILKWEAAYGEKYDIFTSPNGINWKKVFTQNAGIGGTEDIDFTATKSKYLKIQFNKRGTGWGYSILEIVFKTTDEPFGIGMKEPDILFKRAWNFKAFPEKKVFIPKSWKKSEIKVLLGAVPFQYTLYINGKKAADITDTKKPTEIDIKKIVKSGKYNIFSVKPKKYLRDFSFIKLMLIANGSVFDKLSGIKNENPKNYYQLFAELYREGYFPLWLINKQDYWTVVGTDNSYEESLISSKGIIEPYSKSFSLMPFIFSGNELITFADCKITRSLEEGYLPLPKVTWNHKLFSFSQKLFASEINGVSATFISCKVKNTGTRPFKGRFFYVIRPFNVNPPWMHGGLSRIDSIESFGKSVKINGMVKIFCLNKPGYFRTCAYSENDIILKLTKNEMPKSTKTKDSSGFASGVIAYDFYIEPGTEKEYFFVLPLDGEIEMLSALNKKEFENIFSETKKQWISNLNRIRLNIPDSEILNTFRSNLAYILINKDGPALQPGSRSYENSWIRDGAIISAALLRSGHHEAAKNYVRWVASTQHENGEIPCIVNAKTNKLVDYAKEWREYDASGEFVFAVSDYYKFTNDNNTVKSLFPNIEKALKFVKNLRETMLKPELSSSPGYGILPENHSHEGYLNNPQQSLWDDFWSIKGWKDAQLLAKISGKPGLIPWMKTEEQDFRSALINTIKLLQKEKNINYIPASVGLFEFDAISMSVILFPTFEYGYLDKKQVSEMFERYYKNEFLKRLSEKTPRTYIPYEIRGATSLLILGQKDKALKMIRYFLKDLRPKEWNHWAEVVPADPESPSYVGDMPHSWIGAIYIIAVRTMFAFEENDTLVLGAGIDEKWLNTGISVENLPTEFGNITYSVENLENNTVINVSGNALPEKGFIFRSPYAGKNIKKVMLNNKNWKDFSEKQIHFNKLPVEIVLSY